MKKYSKRMRLAILTSFTIAGWFAFYALFMFIKVTYRINGERVTKSEFDKFKEGK